MTFKTLLGIKRQEIMSLKQRYVTGLEKLDFAASQVSIMQKELSDLQPELIKTSAETEKLMIKIEEDTVEVEAKKEVRTIAECFFILLFLLFSSFEHKTFNDARGEIVNSHYHGDTPAPRFSSALVQSLEDTTFVSHGGNFPCRQTQLF